MVIFLKMAKLNTAIYQKDHEQVGFPMGMQGWFNTEKYRSIY